MSDDRPLMPSPLLDCDDGVPGGASSGLTRTEFDGLVAELHDLRSTYQRRGVAGIAGRKSAPRARPGQIVRAELPGRRDRALRILDVTPSLGASIAAREGDAEAA